MPWRCRRSKMCPRQGLLTIETIGLGRLIVRGRRRLPSPPAMTTACMGPSLGERGSAQSFPPGKTLAWAIRAENALKIKLRVGAERDVSVRPCDAGHLRDAAGDDVGEILVLAGADHHDEVDLTGDRVDLGHAWDRGEVF